MEKERLLTYGGTRILQDDFHLIGTVFPDTAEKHRLWTIQGVYAPMRNRSIQGIRVKLIDQKEYVTFINQLDLEVMLGIARPGEKCRWTGRKYAEPGDRDFFGMCVDEDDLLDDLFDREQLLRGEYPGGLPDGLEIVRRIHLEDYVDIEERLILLWDGDPATGMYPDYRFETVAKRWASVEKNRAPYNQA